MYLCTKIMQKNTRKKLHYVKINPTYMHVLNEINLSILNQ